MVAFYQFMTSDQPSLTSKVWHKYNRSTVQIQTAVKKKKMSLWPLSVFMLAPGLRKSTFIHFYFLKLFFNANTFKIPRIQNVFWYRNVDVCLNPCVSHCCPPLLHTSHRKWNWDVLHEPPYLLQWLLYNWDKNEAVYNTLVPFWSI